MCFDIDNEEDEITQIGSFSICMLTIIGIRGKQLYNIHSRFLLWSFQTIFWAQQVRQIRADAVIAPLSRHENRVVITPRLARRLALADGMSLVRDWQLGKRKKPGQMIRAPPSF